MYRELKQQLDRIEKYSAMSAKNIYDVDECAIFTGYKRSQIYALTHRKQIPHYKCGAKLVFKRDELEKWMTSNKVLTQAQAQSQAITSTL